MTQKYKKIILFANGELPEPGFIADRVKKEDFLIAVDGGLNHITSMGFIPDLIIGDMDSVNEEMLEHFRELKVRIEKYPVQKDQNDLELGIQAAVSMEPEKIWIVAALGGRIDQTLVNIFLLTREDLRDIDAHIIDGERDIFLIRNETAIHGELGQRVSLIPINGPVQGIRTEGLQYPLKDETLFPDQTRGISNQLITGNAKITVEHGLLLCIQQITNTAKRRY